MGADTPPVRESRIGDSAVHSLKHTHTSYLYCWHYTQPTFNASFLLMSQPLQSFTLSCALTSPQPLFFNTSACVVFRCKYKHYKAEKCSKYWLASQYVSACTTACVCPSEANHMYIYIYIADMLLFLWQDFLLKSEELLTCFFLIHYRLYTVTGPHKPRLGILIIIVDMVKFIALCRAVYNVSANRSSFILQTFNTIRCFWTGGTYS